MDYIYADHAATTPLLDQARSAMEPWLGENFANASSLYKSGSLARKAVESARRKIANILGADYEEIFFTSGGTESNVSALRGASDAGTQTFICSAIEHHSVLETVKRLGSLGMHTEFVYPEQDGTVTPEAAARNAAKDSLVSVMLANNEIGTIEPIKEIADAVHEKDGIVHCDCVQAAGHIPLSLHKSGVDLASFSAHKFGGPKGAGILYVKRGTPYLPLFTGGAQEWHMRAGTENVAGIVGMAEALEVSCADIESERVRLEKIRAEILSGISKIPYVRINSCAAQCLPGFINVSFSFIEGENIATVMNGKNIAVSPGSACAAGSHDPSHVLTALGLDRSTAIGAVRISLGRTSSQSDAPAIVAALSETVDFLRYLVPKWREMMGNK